MSKQISDDDHPFRFEPNKRYFNISVYTLVVVLIASIIIKTVFNWAETSAYWGKYLSGISSFFVGFFIAYLLNPLVHFLDKKLFQKIFQIKKKNISGALAIVSSYAIIIALLVVIFKIMIPQLLNSCTDIVTNKLPIWYEEVVALIAYYSERLSETDQSYIVDFLNNTFAIDNLLDLNKITSLLTNLFTTTIPTLIVTSYSLVRVVINFLIAVIYSVYMLFDRKIFGRSMKRLLFAIFPEKFVDELLDTASHCNHIFIHYVTGKIIDSLIIGTLCFIFMNILGLPYSMLISVVVGVTNMIPYFGPWIGFIPGALILALIDPMKSVIYMILVFILQQFDGFILGPKILGDSTGLRPVWILFSITAGGTVAGVIGMFLGVPVVAIIMYLVTRWIDGRLAKKKIGEEKVAMKEEGEKQVLNETKV